MTRGDDVGKADRSLPEFLPPEADEVAEATTPIERRPTPPEESRTIDRSKGAALLVGSGILLSRLAGLVRQTMMARYLGAGFAADAFNAAFRIPNMLQNLFGEGVLSASFIPEYAGLLGKGDEKEATRLAGAVAGMLALVAAIIVLLGVLTAPLLVAVVANGFTGEKRELTVLLTRILFPGAGFLVFSAWCLGILNSHHRFFMSYTAPVIWNFAMVAALIFFHEGRSETQLAIYLAYASVVGSALQFGIQLPQVLSLARGVRPRLTAATASIRNVFRNFVPAFVGRGVVQLSAFVDEWLASYLGNGAVSSFTYAQTIYVLPISLFGMAISAAELPTMARAVGTTAEISAYLRVRLSEGLDRIAYFIVPSAVALFALGDLIVHLLFESGKFNRGNTIWVWQILIGSTIGILASTMGRLYSSTFYAMRDTRTPLRYAVVRVILTTLLGYFFALVLPGLLGVDRKLGAAGLTASAGIAGWVEFYLLRREMDKRIGQTRLVPARMLRLWGAAIGAAAIPWAYKLVADRGAPLLSTHETVLYSKLIALILLAVYGLTYLAATAAFGIPEARNVIDRGARLLRLARRAG
ncbi:MAG TPA: murein biosynthesis integral membrane protein MurJ [Gemmatimonadaceae bacterium]|nr:murein biosynthesis integral membrane protein MurJ [Gemmatimonadaceae bacterium]